MRSVLDGFISASFHGRKKRIHTRGRDADRSRRTGDKLLAKKGRRTYPALRPVREIEYLRNDHFKPGWRRCFQIWRTLSPEIMFRVGTHWSVAGTLH